MDGQQVMGNTAALKMLGLIDDRHYTVAGTERGRRVHLACHYLIRRRLDWSSIKPIEGYVLAFRRFRSDYQAVIKRSEYVTGNALYRYGTTVDCEGTVRGEPAIVELKTGDVSWWVAFQTALQAACFDEPHVRYAVQLRGDGQYRAKEYTDPEEIPLALSMVTIANLKWRNDGYNDFTQDDRIL